ncbi:MAG: cadherin domain-containing protein [Bacteroidota bacterium]|nr:cadherin domain-containing protein [Bacteroidota bacterium]
MAKIFTKNLVVAFRNKVKYYLLLVISLGFTLPGLGNKLNGASTHGSLLAFTLSSPPKSSTFIEGPTFAESLSFTIPQNTTVGTTVDTLNATDPDGDALTYSILAGNTNGAFLLDSTSGVLKVAKSLNHHTQGQYELSVKASDVAGLSAETTVTILIEKSTAIPTFSSLVWSTAASQPYDVSEAQGETVKNKLYTFGGFDSQKSGFTPTSRAFVYDPAVNVWASIAPMPPMNGTNYGGVTHAGFATDGNDIYFAGGYTSNAAGTGQMFGTKEVWKYIVAENRYERLPDLPIVVAAGQLEYLNGRLHHIAGTNQARTEDLGDHYVLDLDNLAGGWTPLAPLPNPRQHAGSTVFEGKIYYLGGQKGHDAKLVTQKDVHVYDPSTDTWTEMASLPVPAGSNGRGHISSSVIVVGDQILVLAGETVFNTGRTNLVSAYTPATNTWVNLAPLPEPRYSGVASFLNNAIFYTGGSRSNITFKSTIVLSPAQNLVTNLTGNTGGIYRIGELVLGTTFYTDRAYQVTDFPSNLDKALLIETPNDDKAQTADEVFSFELTEKATVYVAYDARAKVLPAWLSDWQKLPDTLTSNDPKYNIYILYSKTFPAGKVSIGGNLTPPAQGALSNYIAIVVPANTTGVNPEQEKKGMELILYPNPIKQGNPVKVSLTGLKAREEVTVSLHDRVGRVIGTQQLTANSTGKALIELTITHSLPAGLYLVKARGKTYQKQAKLLIQ